MANTSTNALLAELLVAQSRVTRLTEAAAAGNVMIVAGTRDDPDSFDQDGGKAGPLGFYPIEDVNGETRFFPCMDRLRHEAIDGVDAALAATEVIGDGLLQSDGAIGETLTLKVTASSTALAIAMLDDATAMTPKSTGDVLKVAIPLYPNRAAVTAIVVPATVQRFTVAGYAKPGDRGDADFVRVTAEPAHPGKLKDAAGVWFEQQGPDWRPQHFGYFPGTPDATAGLTAADAAAKATGGWMALRGRLRWNILSFTQTCGWAFGEDRATTRVARNGSVAAPLWVLGVGAANMLTEQITFDGQSVPDNQSLLQLGFDFTANVTVRSCGFENGMNRWALRGDPKVVFNGLHLTDNAFKNLPAGGIMVLCQPGSRGSRFARLNRNTFDQVGGNLCSIRGTNGPDGLRWNGVIDVEGNDNVMTNCLNTGADGPIPFEFWGCTNGQHMRNKISTGTRGLGMGAEMQNFEIAFNDVSDQSLYAVEGGTCRNVWIHHNTARNCKTFIPIPTSNETDGLVIEDNVLIGTGLNAYNTAAPTDVIFVGGYARGLRVRRNRIVNPEYSRWAVSLPLSRPVPNISLTGGGTGAGPVVTLKAVRVRLRTGNDGVGYTNPTVAVQGGGGTGMVITPTFTQAGTLLGGVVTNPGTGYTTAPTLVVTDPTGKGGELEVLMGVEAVTSTGGTGYANGTWTASGVGIPTGAAGTFTQVGGVPTTFTVTTAGEGFGRVSDGLVEDMEILGETYASTPNGITAQGNVRIVRPVVRRLARLDTAHYLVASGAGISQIAFAAHSSPLNNPLSTVENPTCEMLGELGAGVSLYGIGNAMSGQPLYGLDVRGGRINGSYTQPIFVPDTSGAAKVGQIDVSGVTGNAYNIGAAIVRRRTGEVIEGTAAPTTGTWRTGAIVEHSAPTDTSPIRWQCIAGGTPGIWVARNGVGSDPVLTGSSYQLLSAFTSSRKLTMLASVNPTIKIRSEALTGQGQAHVTLRVLWGGRNNNIARQGEFILTFNSFDVSDASPRIDPIAGDAITTSTAKDGTGRIELTITLPVNAAAWLSIDGIANAAANYARYSIIS